jgi:glycine/betaine/sarcosine/D-proline reductase family selenoprotein B
VKELERAGIPTAHVCSIIPVALMVGSSRIIAGSKIVNPLGNADLEPTGEKGLRRAILRKALEALQKEVSEQTLFDQPT